MKLRNWRAVPQALAIVGMVSSMGAATAWGKAGDNGSFVIIEGLWLTKDDGDTTAFTAPDPTGNFNLVTTDDVELDSTGGARATIQFQAWGQGWQASAFGVGSFDQEFFVEDLDEPVSNTSTTYAELIGGTDPSTNRPFNSDEIEALELGLEADLWGAELSWVKRLGSSNIDLLVGVRYIHYGEELSSIAYDDWNDIPGNSPLGDNDDIDDAFIGVDNDLVGLQVGLQAMWDITPSIAIGGTLKGGVAANFVDRERSFNGRDNNVFDYADSHDDTGFAQFAEFNPRVDIALSETATLTIGGTVLWINETSRAASHYQTIVDQNDSNLRDDDDELFYGASIGLRLALN